jgi:two-component system phosphate regulon sensor histidine kinase PhoR
MVQAGVVAVLCGLLLLAIVVAYRWAKALHGVTRGVMALGEGRPARATLTRVSGPVGRLTRVFDEMAPQLETRIAHLEQDRQQLRAVLSGMAEGVIAIDGRRRLLFANASADRLFGLDATAVGRLVPELIRSPHVQGAVEATLASFGSYQGEITLASREAGMRPAVRVLAVHGTPLPGLPPSGAVLVFHDITELRRLERLRQELVANVSHELKTPLASIKAYAETLLDWALHDERVNVRFLQRIEEQADRLNQLILDLLSLARLESGEDIFEHGPLAISPVIASCLEAQRGRAEAKGLNLTLDLGGVDETTCILADEEAVRQILDNLIDNALKYTPTGGSVRVTCALVDHNLAIEVADSGIGIPPNDLPRIFERFYRVDKARSRELGGTGLGLSIVKHLVQSIGGQIGVESRVGEGSRFTVQLPLATAPVPLR